MQIGGSASSAILIAPVGATTFPTTLSLVTDDGSNVEVLLQVAGPGAGIEVPSDPIQVGAGPVQVDIHATSVSTDRDDTTIHAFVNGALEGSISITSIERPSLWFEGRFEVRFATGAAPYNDPRGNPDGTGLGWMWALEGEPDFVPADSVPDTIEKPVGRVIRFHNPVALRSHVPPIGVFVSAIEGDVSTGRLRFDSGDAVIGKPISLGPNTYFASNRPVNPTDRAAGRLPEEQHNDGFQPLALFELKIGDWFRGGSQVGPFVPGTTESSNPRTPDSRPRGQGLASLSQGERGKFPFPSRQEFAEDRIQKLLADFQALKDAGNTNSVDFRNLRLRIGHLLSDATQQTRDQALAAHADVNLVVLSPNASFAWGNREVYRGNIDDAISFQPNESAILNYLSTFATMHFLGVFFNFHTDEACAHCYGAVDPVQPPATL